MLRSRLELEAPEPEPKAGQWRIDLGLKSFLVTSDGRDSPAQTPAESPKTAGASATPPVALQERVKRQEKARLALARQHEKVANQRSDFLQKVSHHLTQTYGLIGLEDLNVQGMLKNHRLARAPPMRGGVSSNGNWPTKPIGMAVC